MKTTFILFIILLITTFQVPAQSKFRVMFYNVENLFDTFDDPEKEDSDFLPEGSRRWTQGRYRNKLNNIARVISSAGEWDTPVLVGMCEVENDTVVRDLIQYSPLKKMKYRYVMTRSADARGIDVALLYQRDRYKYIGHHCYRVHFPKNPQKKTRDILHVSGQVISGDTLDVFVCHFPSRRSGELESEPDRVQVASIVRAKVDSLMKIRGKANILIMGDFNDEPSNKSIAVTLGALPSSGKILKTNLYNLFHAFEKRKNEGSYKYGRQWNMLDQVIVSGNLMDRKQHFHVLPETATIFRPEFLTTEDTTNGGIRPKKTFHGMKHEGGFSDHFPVLVDFSVSSAN